MATKNGFELNKFLIDLLCIYQVDLSSMNSN